MSRQRALRSVAFARCPPETVTPPHRGWKTWGFRAIDRLAAYPQAVADIDRNRSIAADPNAVWDVLADFGSISSWADNLDHSCILNHGSDPVGTTRRVQIGRNALVERIIEVRSADMGTCLRG